MNLGPYELNQIYTGDARELAEQIPDESVDLIFTDPIYWQIEDYAWLSGLGVRVLKPGGCVLAYTGYYWLDKVMLALSEHLNYRWILTERKLNGRAVIWHYKLFSQTKPLLWYSKGNPVTTDYKCDFRTKLSEGDKVNHEWSKGEQTVIAWLESFSLPGTIVLDPFAGGGAMLAACKILGRNYLAFEIDPTTAESARQRVALTQAPLFVLQPEQLELVR